LTETRASTVRGEESPTESDGKSRVRAVAAQAGDAIARLRSAAARLTTNGIAQTAAIVEIARTARGSANRVRGAGIAVSEARTRSAEADEQLRSAARGIEELTAASSELAAVTKNALGSIGELLALTDQIEGIVDFVRDVSERTNLLALNASIEAARAGVHGRGFSVVASEVRKLAESTRSATRDMDTLLARIAERGASTGAFGNALDAAVSGSERSATGARAALDAISAAVGAVVATFAEVEELIESEVSAADQYGSSATALLRTVREHFADTAETQQWIANVAFQNNELAALGSGTPVTIHTPVRTLRVACAVAADSPPARMLEVFKGELETLARGELRVELIIPYAKPPAQLLIDLRTADLALASVNCSVIANLIPPAQLFELPYLVRSRRHAFALFDGPHGRALLGRGASVDLAFLAFSENGVRHYTNDVREIRVAEDLRDLRMRTLDGPIHLYTASALDVTPYPMPIGKVHDALRDHRIDGQDNPLGTIVSTRFYEHQRYLTLSAHTYVPQVVVGSPEVLGALGSHRTLVETALDRAIAWQREHAARLDAESLAQLRRHMHVTQLTEEQRQTFVRATAHVYDRAADLVGERELVALRRAADAAAAGLGAAPAGWT